MILEATLVNQYSTADAKIRLFRSLFRGRDDVYPPRFESRKTGKSGYAPACGNEWIRGICEKPRIKCADCQHQRFLPITDEVIRWHLSGFDLAGQPFVAGIYPMLQDETCFFLAVDFDKEGWRKTQVHTRNLPCYGHTGCAGTVPVRSWRACVVLRRGCHRSISAKVGFIRFD
jgi:hypothetical protein